MVWKIKPLEIVQKEITEQYPYLTINPKTYTGTADKCEFIDEKYGSFYLEPAGVLKGRMEHWKRRIEKNLPIKSQTSEMLEYRIQLTRPYISIKHETYINTQKKCIFIDSEYGEWEAYPMNVLILNYGNPNRGKVNFIKKLTKSPELVEQEAKAIHGDVVSLDYTTYTNGNIKARWIHSKFGEWWAKPSNVVNTGTGHPRAANGHVRSLEINNWLNSYSLDFKENIRCLPKHREIDYLIGNFGIEYCGLWWHREDEKGKVYHYRKFDDAEKMGITLFTIFEDEWINKREILQSIILSKLDKHPHIKGQKCKVREIPKSEWLPFLQENHLQGGNKNSIFGLGLFHKEELVGVITGNKHHRNNNAPVLILDRLCFKKGVTVEFGSSKLFHYFKQKTKELNYNTILSWSDNRYSNGSVYKALGFELTGNLRPDYSYFKRQERVSKQSMKKTPKERLTGKTELQLRTEQGWFRIWDCGKKTWSYTL